VRIIEIDALKGVAIVGVVFAHIALEGRLELITVEATKSIQSTLGWCVLAFFWTSGFLTQRRQNSITDVYGFVKQRFLRLVLPCVVFSISYKVILWVLYFTGAFSWEYSAPLNIQEVLEFALKPVGPQFYFLYYLFGISSVFSLVCSFLEQKVFFLFSATLLPILYLIIDIPQSGYGPDSSLIPFYFFSYVAGVCISNFSGKQQLLAILMFLLSVFLVSIIGKSIIPLYILIPCILQFYFKKVPRLAKLIDITKVGKFSSGIYVWHAPIVLPFVSIVCVKVFGGGIIVLVPIVIGTLGVSVFFSWLTFNVPCLKFWRF